MRNPQKYSADSVVIGADAVSGERLIAVVIEPQGRASASETGSAVAVEIPL